MSDDLEKEVEDVLDEDINKIDYKKYQEKPDWMDRQKKSRKYPWHDTLTNRVLYRGVF